MDIGPARLNLYATATTQAPTPSERAPEVREMIENVKAINKSELLGNQNELSFTFDRTTKKPVIRIVDRETKKVIRTIPPEYLKRLTEELSST